MKPILLVDDDADCREAVTDILRDEGFVVHGAGDGLEALEVLAKLAEPPGLVLLDSRMPRMSGADFLAAARRTHPDLAVVVMSAQTRGLPLADGALPKPVPAADLVSVAHEFCGDGQPDGRVSGVIRVPGAS